MQYHLQELILKSIPQQEQWKITLLSQWNEIMGNINAQVTLEKIEQDMLVLGVTNSCWMQELYLLSPLLLTIINQKLDQPRIKRLRFKKITIKQKRAMPENKQHKKMKSPLPLTSPEKKALDRITDSSLREALYAFKIRCDQEK